METWTQIATVSLSGGASYCYKVRDWHDHDAAKDEVSFDNCYYNKDIIDGQRAFIQYRLVKVGA